MDAEILDIIILLGAVQGFILSILLFTSGKRNILANRLLAVFILLVAFSCLNIYLSISEIGEEYPMIRAVFLFIPAFAGMPFGPLLYFYTRSLMEQDFAISRKNLWLFAPVIIDLIPTAMVWILTIGLYTELATVETASKWGDFIDEYNVYSDIPRWISLTIYVFISKHYLQTLSNNNASLKQQSDFKWVKFFVHFFLAFLALWFCFLVLYINPSTRDNLLDSVGWYPLYILLAVTIYWIGLRGYFQLKDDGRRKIAQNLIPTDVIDNTTAALVKAMETEKIYRDPALNLALLSTRVGIQQKTISAVINQHLKKSFNEFINEYRVGEVQQKLKANTNGHLTITGIAFECGFNSQATFQRAFKQITGLTPTEYARNLKN